MKTRHPPKCNVLDGSPYPCEQSAVFIAMKNGKDTLHNGARVCMCELHSRGEWGGLLKCRLVEIKDYII